MIELKDIQKIFGDKTAVDIPEFTISQGEILGLVGNNGAGKTTLFRLLLDLLKADSGTVRINDVNPAETESWKEHTGAFIDDSFLIDFLTPEEYFYFVGKVNGLSKEEVDSRLEQFTAFMGGEVMEQKKLIRDFSAGNKQKIGIISAMLNKPEILILDEPFNFLDPSSQHILKQLILSYNKESNATILISSHNLQHTVEISTRIALLEHGVIIKDLPNENQSAEAELDEYFNV
jgi:ABC-2 type transport system ATP-binding protein